MDIIFIEVRCVGTASLASSFCRSDTSATSSSQSLMIYTECVYDSPLIGNPSEDG